MSETQQWATICRALNEAERRNLKTEARVAALEEWKASLIRWTARGLMVLSILATLAAATIGLLTWLF